MWTCLGTRRSFVHQQKYFVTYNSIHSFRSYRDGLIPHAAAGEEKDPSNKASLDSDLFEYIVHHIREDDVLKELRETTLRQFPKAAKMAVGPEQGSFLRWLVKVLRVQNAIEIGVFTGYSSICIGTALKESNGRLMALDRDAEAMDVAQGFWERLDLVPGVIDARCAPAMESLVDIRKEYGDESFDFAFVDADKRGYRDYYEELLHLIRPGGVIAIDNVLWYGKVADPSVNDKTTEALRELNAFLRDDARVDMTLVPVGDGLTLCTKLAIENFHDHE
ncbi:hypothetical protein M9434_006729 [Picochlorum sp. BPE23]|nr:hypothetical protein M9434_006729 [Picochlorum sp. BPE23]